MAVVAPSGGLEKDEAPLLGRGVGTLEGMGFVVRLSPLVDLDRSWWWAAAPPAEVAEDLNRHLRDPDVRALFSLTGGRVAEPSGPKRRLVPLGVTSPSRPRRAAPAPPQRSGVSPRDP